MNTVDIIKDFIRFAKLPEMVICLGGLSVFAVWLLRTSLGRNSLSESLSRRNNMPYFLPLVPMFVWFGLVSAAVQLSESVFPGLNEVDRAMVNHLFLLAGGVLVTGIMLFLAGKHFERGLKGFGLDIRTVLRDIEGALVNLLAVWPILIAAIIVTTYIGTLIAGPDFEMPKHEELKLLIDHRNFYLRLVVVFVTALIIPILEELLFRGFFQTMIRSFLADLRFFQNVRNMPLKPWAAILMTSVLFTIVHFNLTHWPALFILSICLGYSYEKSGSLLRPIFIHALFNGASLAATLSGLN